MQKAILFFLAVAIILFLAFSKPVEGFTNLMGVNWNEMNEGTPAALYTKLPINEPKVVDIASAGIGNVQPSPPAPGTLPSAPAPQRSKETPNPYRDPTLEPAKYIRILGVKEDLQAFFGFQAFMLEERNDPAIQIPLTRARADMSELIDVQSVMERNPGLPSRINNKQLDDIQSNLRYLREVLHDLESSGAIQPEAIEGFQNITKPVTQTAPVTTAKPVSAPAPASKSKSKSKPKPAPAPAPTPAPASSAKPVSADKRASLKELQEFQIKVVVEIKRLGASGTSDPVIVGRINTLNRIKNDVDDVIEQIQNGFLTPETIPIFSTDIEKALPYLGKPSDPLPTILRKNKLPPAIANLFPGGLSPKDTEQALQINNIVKGYMKNISEGVSWDVNVRYDNPKIMKLKAEINKNKLNSKGQANINMGLPGVNIDTQKNQQQGNTSKTRLTASVSDDTRTSSAYNTGLPGLSISRVMPKPKVGKLDWKQRSAEIKEQIRRRKLNPLDFGALPDDAVVGKDFSWRGYTQMMCMRLNTTMDPGLATTCGCPPQNWSGWSD